MTQDNTPPTLPGDAVWLITGCSTGFGRELARQALAQGYRVAVTARDPAEVEDLASHGEALVLKLDVQGRVQSAATEKIDLLGAAPRQSNLNSMAVQFRRSAERAAAGWLIPGQSEAGLVRVPVRYTMGQRSSGWAQTTAQKVELPEWAVLELSKAQAKDLSTAGMATAEQFKLLTPLDGA